MNANFVIGKSRNQVNCRNMQWFTQVKNIMNVTFVNENSDYTLFWLPKGKVHNLRNYKLWISLQNSIFFLTLYEGP